MHSFLLRFLLRKSNCLGFFLICGVGLNCLDMLSGEGFYRSIPKSCLTFGWNLYIYYGNANVILEPVFVRVMLVTQQGTEN